MESGEVKHCIIYLTILSKWMTTRQRCCKGVRLTQTKRRQGFVESHGNLHLERICHIKSRLRKKNIKITKQAFSTIFEVIHN